MQMTSAQMKKAAALLTSAVIHLEASHERDPLAYSIRKFLDELQVDNQVVYDRPVNFTATNRYGSSSMGEDDVYTVAEFLEIVESGGFDDYDGSGRPVKDRKAANICIRPSNQGRDIPPDATHILWLNK